MSLDVVRKDLEVLRSTLEFIETGRRVVRQQFRRNFQRAYAKALRTAR